MKSSLNQKIFIPKCKNRTGHEPDRKLFPKPINSQNYAHKNTDFIKIKKITIIYSEKTSKKKHTI